MLKVMDKTKKGQMEDGRRVKKIGGRKESLKTERRLERTEGKDGEGLIEEEKEEGSE